MDAFEFAFTTRLPGFIADHVIKFSFLDLQHVPNRINVLIGKNGAGKTSLLRQLADAIGGGSEPLGVFSPLRPPFSRALAVSYSAFDPFRRSQQTVDGESYRYIGIYENDTLRTRDAIATSCGNAIRRVHELKREDTWHEVIDSALGTTVAESLKGCFTPREDIGHRIRNLYLSSGQLMLATIVSELNAYIEKDAVVLLDEPETHLHPNAIGALLRGLDTLLRRLGAFAIIATHSPLVVQQIPRRYVRVLRSIDRVPTVAVLEEECFGENLTSITQDVFHGCETPSLFQIWTRDPAGALALSTDSAFVRELGFAAKTSLASSKLQ